MPDNVISLSDRVLGNCARCAEPVRFAENFVRVGRAFVHVRCALRPEAPRPPASDFPRPVPDGPASA